MFHNYTEEELRSICRTSIESLEMWARRLINEKMTENYGVDYINAKVSAEEYLINKEIRNHVQRMLSQQPNKFSCPTNTLFLDQIVYFLCHPKLYLELFKEALDYIYPQGRDEAKEFLSRLIPIRNPLSHSNSISVHQAEQAICYSHDFVEGLKKYYKDRGLEQVWNVPRIIRITDSLGNVFENPNETHGSKSIFLIPQKLYFGDTYSVHVEVDSSFPTSAYDIIWTIAGMDDSKFKNSTKYSLTMFEKNVGENNLLGCKIVSHEKWHKYHFFDCEITLMYTVLPPKN